MGQRNKSTNETVTVSCPDFKTTVERSLIPPPRNFRKTVSIGSDVYIFDEGLNKKVYKNIFEVYIKKTNVCKELEFFDNRIRYFSVCSFMSSVYVFGGYFNDYNCYKYDKMTQNWWKLANLNVNRYSTTCSVFQGKIVISGGNKKLEYMKSVKAYDHHENKWNFITKYDSTQAPSFFSYNRQQTVYDRRK